MTQQQMIPLAEVAKVFGSKPETVRAECAELGLWVGPDWAGRDAVVEPDARALVSGAARRQMEHKAGEKEHLARVAAWEQARTAACRAGEEEAEERLRRRRRGGSPAAVMSARREGFREAGKRFERTTARPEFGGSREWTKLSFVSPAEEGRGAVVGAVVGKLRGGPAEAPAPGSEVA